MSVQLQIARLEALLATIRTNAADLVRTRRGTAGISLVPSANSTLDVSDDDLELMPSEDEQKRAAAATLPPGAPVEEVTGERPALGFDLGLTARVESTRTPPPESGPQMALPQEFSDIPMSAPGKQSAVPTLEQLGSTVDLEEAGPIELQVEIIARRPTLPPPFDEDLEASLPSRRMVGTYDASLAPPAGAQAELEAHDRQERERAADRRSSLPAPDPARVTRPPTAAPSAITEPAVWERPSIPAAHTAAVFDSAPRRSASEATFLELLDSSLAQ